MMTSVKRKGGGVVKSVAGIGDDAVRKATGKTWAQWGRLLDRAGAKKMSHKEIAAHLVAEQGVGPWWQQMVTVGYEQSRGLRQKHEMPSGYQISRSKTLPVAVAALYRAWKDPTARSKWLDGDGLVIRKATANKSIRVTWGDGKTTVEVMFYVKGPSKSQVTVQHNKLPDAKAAQRMKEFWGKQLDGLAKHLGQSSAVVTTTKVTKRARPVVQKRAKN